MQRRGGARGLGAVLFTDIVGSTSVAAEMGNARWGELVARHHRLIRRQLRRYGGQEIDTAGDGFFATFERPVDAIRCAVAAADAVRELGIEIRAGVSFGELETVGNKPGGLVVNTAARVMSVAGPGEVLVPAAVRDLVPGAGIAFVDHGVHRLKGLDDELRLFLVRGLDGAPLATPLEEKEAAERRRAIVPAARRRSRALIVGIAAAAVAAGAIWFLAAVGEDEPQRAAALASRFVVELDRETGKVSQRIDFTDPGRPERGGGGYDLVAGQGALWAQPSTDVTPAIFRVDPEHAEVHRIALGSSGVYFISMVSAFDALWATTDHLIHVNPSTDEARPVTALPSLGIGLGGATLAADRRNLWVGTPGGILLRLDPSGEETGRREVANAIQLVAAGEGWVWIVDQTAGIVRRIDPGTLDPAGSPITLTGNIDAIAVLDGYVWTLDFGTGVLTRISIDSGRVTAQEALPPDPTALAAGAGAVWVSHEDGIVTRIDPATITSSEFARVEGSARAIAVDEDRDSVWVDVIRRD